MSNNPHMNPPTAASVARFWARPYFDMYIPATYTAWCALAAVARTTGPDGHSRVLDPSVFHTTNVLLHAGAALMVYLILRRLLAAAPRAGNATTDRASDWAACAGALLFAVHPLQVEPVAWVSGLRDVLGGTLALVAAWSYLVFASGGRRKGLAYAGGLVAFALSLLSKPSAVSLPLALAALDYVVLRRDPRRVAVALAPWLAVAAAITVGATIAQPSAAERGAPAWARPVVALDAVAFYVGKILAPASLGIDYGRTPAWVLSHAAAWWTWAVPVTLAAIAWANRRRWPVAAAGAAVFAAMLLPVLGLMKFEFQHHSTVADRYAYLAMLGAAMILAAVVRARPTRVTAVVVVCFLAGYGARAYAQVWTWRDSTTLFSHAADVNPGSLAGNNWLGLDAASRGDYETALRYMETALAAHPDDPLTSYNLGGVLLDTNHPAEAVPFLRVALRGRLAPVLYYNLSLALARSGDLDGGVAACREGLARWPGNADLHEMMGDLLSAKGDWAGSAGEYEAALKLNPNLPRVKQRLPEVIRRAAAASRPTTRP